MDNHPIIDELRAEHREMMAMLSVIEKEISALCNTGTSNLDRLLGAVEYCHAYPGAKHHPKEDIVYARLLEVQPGVEKKLGNLTNEHGVLGDYTRRLKLAIESVVADEIVEKEYVAGLAHDYMDMLRRHMRVEEVLYFPAALATLGDEDWAVISASIAELADEPRDDRREKRFDKLRDIAAVIDP